MFIASDPSRVREVGKRMSRATARRILVPTWAPSYMLKLRCLSTRDRGTSAPRPRPRRERPTSWQDGPDAPQSTANDQFPTIAPRPSQPERDLRGHRQDSGADHLRQLGTGRPFAEGNRARGAARPVTKLLAGGGPR